MTTTECAEKKKTKRKQKNVRSRKLIRGKDSQSNWVMINIPVVLAAIQDCISFFQFFFDLGALQTWPTWYLMMLLFNGV